MSQLFSGTNVPEFIVQVLLAIGTIWLAIASIKGMSKATEASNEANRLTEASAEAARKSAEKADKLSKHMYELESARSRVADEQGRRAQADLIWVSMIVVKKPDESLQYGVLKIRNTSNQPVRNMKIVSRGRISGQGWFDKDECHVPVVFPGDTLIGSRKKTTDWDIPRTYFPYFSDSYSHAVGPLNDPYYVTSVEFDDAGGRTWKLENGHCLEPADD